MTKKTGTAFFVKRCPFFFDAGYSRTSLPVTVSK